MFHAIISPSLICTHPYIYIYIYNYTIIYYANMIYSTKILTHSNYYQTGSHVKNDLYYILILMLCYILYINSWVGKYERCMTIISLLMRQLK